MFPKSIVRQARLVLALLALVLVATELSASAALGPAGAKAYVANTENNTVSVVDLSDMTVSTAVDVGSEPRGVAITPDGEFVYVANRFGSILNDVQTPSVSVLSTTTDEVVAVIGLSGSEPYDLAVTPDGSRVYVACKGSSSVVVVSTATNAEISSIPLSSENASPEGIAITPDGSKVYVVNRQDDTVDVISTVTNAIVGGPLSVGSAPRDAKVTADGAKVLVVGEGAPVVILTASDTASTTTFEDIGTQRNVAMAGNLAYVTNFSYFPSMASSLRAPEPGQGSLDIYDMATESYVASVGMSGTKPYAVDVLPDGSAGWVSQQDSNSVQGVDLVAQAESGSAAEVGSGPRGLAVFVPVPVGCQENSDCNDDIVCTVDSCNTETGDCTNDDSQCPCPNDCGDPAVVFGTITAVDAGFILRTSVELETCELCVCDVDDSGEVLASDALSDLRYAVGLPDVLVCPAKGDPQ